MIAKEVWSAITDDHIDTAFSTTKHLLDIVNSLLSCDIALEKCGTLDRSHLEEVDGDQMRLSKDVNAILF